MSRVVGVLVSTYMNSYSVPLTSLPAACRWNSRLLGTVIGTRLCHILRGRHILKLTRHVLGLSSSARLYWQEPVLNRESTSYSRCC